jgi:hypothetical protein
MGKRKLPNYDKPVLSVTHAKLERASEESAYRSRCPLCAGQLLGLRDQVSLQLLRQDRCVRCGQPFEYIDDEIAGEKLPAAGGPLMKGAT